MPSSMGRFQLGLLAIPETILLPTLLLQLRCPPCAGKEEEEHAAMMVARVFKSTLADGLLY